MAERPIDPDLPFVHDQAEFTLGGVPTNAESSADHPNGVRATLDMPLGIFFVMDRDLSAPMFKAEPRTPVGEPLDAR